MQLRIVNDLERLGSRKFNSSGQRQERPDGTCDPRRALRSGEPSAAALGKEGWPHTPKVSVRVTKKGLIAYVKWKSVWNFVGDETDDTPTPLFLCKEWASL